MIPNQIPCRPINLKGFINNLPAGTLGPEHGRYVFGSTIHDSLPYLVKPGALAEIRPEDVLRTPVTRIGHVLTLDTSNEEQRAKLESIISAARSGWFMICHVHRWWDPVEKKMWVYIEYLDQHRVLNPVSDYDRLMAEAKNMKPRPIK